eukprot:2318489-Prymnesium_polylepis.2
MSMVLVGAECTAASTPAASSCTLPLIGGKTSDGSVSGSGCQLLLDDSWKCPDAERRRRPACEMSEPIIFRAGGSDLGTVSCICDSSWQLQPGAPAVTVSLGPTAAEALECSVTMSRSFSGAGQ